RNRVQRNGTKTETEKSEKNKRKREHTESKLERRNKYRELKKTLKEVWTTEIESGEDENAKIKENMDVPSHYRKFTIEDRKVVLTPPIRERKENESYDGPEDAKKVDLAAPGEPPRPVYIATDLSPGEEERLLSLLREYRDVFAWSYKDLKGVDPSICQHTIPLKQDAKPSRQRPYTYNDTFAKRIKEEIDKLMEAEFIYEIEHTDWVSPIVVVPKKNKKLRVCVNLKQVNVATIRDNFPLPISEYVLERLVGKEAYNFLDGFSGCNQLWGNPIAQHNTAFTIEWGIFAYRVMLFGLTNAPTTFHRLMSHGFKMYLRKFLEVYMDDL
ncbi:hypothetical protein DD598_26130, partial [Enterobacter cloacae complex sp. 2DZ2F16B1]